MRPHVRLLFKPLTTSQPSFDQRFHLTSVPLKLAEASYISLAGTDVLIQSISHHLTHIQVYNYKVKRDFVVDFEITKDSFFLVAMQDDRSVLYDDADGTFSEILGNSCMLSYLKAGKYKRTMVTGNHQILLLCIEPEWFISKYGNLEELRELIAHYKNNEVNIFRLPSFGISQQLFSSLMRLNTLSKNRDTEIDLHIYLNQSISKYLIKLRQSLATVNYQQSKAKEIADFVKENYASKLVGDEAELANRFMISTTMLIRLAKLAFDKPLHQQVIELRMYHSLRMLLTTQKTIQEISASVGYDDPKYFSRAFKKKFGLPPNEIRICVI